MNIPTCKRILMTTECCMTILVLNYIRDTQALPLVQWYFLKRGFVRMLATHEQFVKDYSFVTYSKQIFIHKLMRLLWEPTHFHFPPIS